MINVRVQGLLVWVLRQPSSDEEDVVDDDHLSNMHNTRKNKLNNTLNFWIFCNIFLSLWQYSSYCFFITLFFFSFQRSNITYYFVNLTINHQSTTTYHSSAGRNNTCQFLLLWFSRLLDRLRFDRIGKNLINL